MASKKKSSPTPAEEIRQLREELEASRTRLENLYDFAPVGYVTVSEDGKILEANLTAATLLGVVRSKLVRKPLPSFILPEDQDTYYRHRQVLFDTGEPQQCEFRMLRPGTLPFWAQMNAVAGQMADGTPICRVTMTDITERKQSEKRLQEHAQLLDSVKESVVATDLDGNILYWGHGAEALYGYTTEEVLFKPYREFAGAIDPPDEKAFRREILKKGSWSGEHLQKTRKGKTFWTSTVISLVRDEKGNPSGFIGIDRDISESRNIEAALGQNEERLRLALVASQHGIWDWDLTTDEVFFDSGYYTMAGYQVDEFPHQLEEFTGRIHPEDVDRVMAVAKEHLEGRIEHFVVEFRFRMKSGDWMWILGKGTVVERDAKGHPLRFTGTHRDITERKQAEISLRESEIRYQRAQQISKTGSWEYDLQNEVFWASDEALRMYALDPKKAPFTPEQVESCVPERERVHQALVDLIEKDQKYDLEFEIHPADGSPPLQMASMAECLRDDQGNPIKVVGAVQDITERKQAELELQQAYARLAMAQREAKAGLWSWDMVTEALHWTTEFFELFGLNPDTTQANFDVWHDVLHPEDLENADKQIADSIRDHTPFKCEYRIVLPSGEIRWIGAMGNTVYDNKDKPLRMAGLCLDITARKQAEDEAKALKARVFAVLDMIPGIVYLQAQDHSIPFANARFIEAFGDPKNRPCYEVIHGRNKPCKDCPTFRVFDTHSAVAWEWSGEDGKTFMVYDEPFPSINKDEPMVLEMLIDITERKQAEEKLQASEELYRSILNTSPDGIAILDIEGKILIASPEVLKMAAIEQEEQLAGRPVIDFIAPEDQERAMTNISLTFQGEKHGPVEYLAQRANGTTLDIEVNAELIQDSGRTPTRMVIMIRDITDRKQAEDALIESEERFRAICEYSPGLINSFDKDGHCVFWNHQCRKTFGWTIDEINAQENPLALFYPDPAIQEEVIQSLTDIQDGVFKEWNPLTKDGQTLTTVWANFRLPGGSIFSLGHDITDRKQAEKKLQDSEQKYSYLVENISSLVFSLNLDGCITFTSSSIADLLGYSPAEVMGHPYPEFIDPRDQPAVQAAWLQVLNGPSQSFECRMITKSGESRWVHISSNLIVKDGSPVGAQGIATDITDRKQAEAQLVEQLEELQRWHATMLSREERVQELKQEINRLRVEAGKPIRFASVEADENGKT